MNRYFLFRELLNFMAKHTEVADADMNTYTGGLLVTGEDDEQTIKIEVTITDKEENNK